MKQLPTCLHLNHTAELAYDVSKLTNNDKVPLYDNYMVSDTFMLNRVEDGGQTIYGFTRINGEISRPFSDSMSKMERIRRWMWAKPTIEEMNTKIIKKLFMCCLHK